MILTLAKGHLQFLEHTEGSISSDLAARLVQVIDAGEAEFAAHFLEPTTISFYLYVGALLSRFAVGPILDVHIRCNGKTFSVAQHKTLMLSMEPLKPVEALVPFRRKLTDLVNEYRIRLQASGGGGSIILS